MAGLTEVSEVARKIIKYGIITLIVIMLIPVAFRIGRQIYDKLHPPPPPPPTVRYGKLPDIVFPDNPAEATPEYTLETISGGLPKLATVGKAYVVGINKSRLLTLDRVKQKAHQLGFTGDPERIDEQNYRFVQISSWSDLVVNVVSGGFAYSYDWTRDPKVYQSFEIPPDVRAIGEAKGYLQGLDLLPDDLARGTAKYKYLVASGSGMVQTDLVYNANFVRVDLFRADKDQMKVVTAGADLSPVFVVISGVQTEKRMVQIGYEFSQILDNDFATYPLKPVTQAWQELTAGQAFIAKKTIHNVKIRKVSLAYYESNEPQQFMQPVFVFEGDGGFTAYVPAIDPQYSDKGK